MSVVSKLWVTVLSVVSKLWVIVLSVVSKLKKVRVFLRSVCCWDAMPWNLGVSHD